MKYDRLKNILNVFNIYELDSIDILFMHVKKYNLELTNKVFKNVQQQKWDKYSCEYEGINEYDYITRINNFDISKTFDYIVLNPYELIYLKRIMEDAIININNNKNPLDLKIVPNIEEALKKVNIRLSELDDLNYLITEEELKNMFNKFDAVEIEEFDHIFEYIEQYNIEKMMDISNTVCEEKIKNAFEEFEVFVRPYNYDIVNLCDKKDILSKKELKLLCILFDDAILGLNSYKEEYDKHKYEECEKLESSLYNLLTSYSEELNNRNSKIYKKL